MEGIIWYLLVQLIALAAFPLSFTLFRFLPEHGYVLSKPLGLLLVAYPVWLAASAGIPNVTLMCWLSLALLGVGLNAWLLLRNGGALRTELWNYFRNHRRYIIIAEIIFGIVYLVGVIYRFTNPEILDHEKFTDYFLVNALIIHDKFPPPDAWFAGYNINYYYYSHLIFAMLTRMSTIPLAITFNLSIVLVFALTVVSVFSIGYNLIWLSAKAQVLKGKSTAYRYAIFIVIIACFSGNLVPIRALIMMAGGEITPGFDWFYISHFGIFSINEFPQFSYLLGDLHAHYNSLPFGILALGFALVVVTQPYKPEQYSLLQSEGRFKFLVVSLFFGLLFFMNSWDYPTYLGIYLFVVFYNLWWNNRQPQVDKPIISWQVVLSTLAIGNLKPGGGKFLKLPLWCWLWGGIVIRILAVSQLLVLPHNLTFVSFTGNQPPLPQFADIPILSRISKSIGLTYQEGTNLGDYFSMFGLFLIIILPWLGLLIWLKLSQSKNRYRILAGSGLIFLVLLAIGSWLDFQLLALLPFIIAGCGYVLFSSKPDPLQAQAEVSTTNSFLTNNPLVEKFILILLAVAAAITIVPEMFYLRDYEDQKINTVFKTHFQAWMLYSVVTGYALWWLYQWLKQGYTPKTVPIVARIWRITFIVLFISTLLYPFSAPYQKANYIFDYPLTLDGTDWLPREALTQEDARAINWLNVQAAKTPTFRGTILEASSVRSGYMSRISTFTGYPTLLGDYFREKLWRDIPVPTLAGTANCGTAVIVSNLPIDEFIYYPLTDFPNSIQNLQAIKRQKLYDQLKGLQQTTLDTESECRLWLVNYIYRTEDAVLAEKLLRSMQVEYVYVGKYEVTDDYYYTRRSSEYAVYSYLALTKFAKFMQPIYQNGTTTIYSFTKK